METQSAGGQVKSKTELISIPFDPEKWTKRQEDASFARAVAAEWGFWRDYDSVELWQAVLLSLNVDPRPEGLLEEDDDVFKRIVGALREVDAPNRWRIDQRLLLARSHIGGNLDGDGERVHLRDFAHWAVSMGWEVPAALSDLGKAAVAEKALGARERNNLYKIIALLAQQAGVDLKEPFAAATAIEAAALEQGLQVREDTIAAALKAASSLVGEGAKKPS